MNKPATPPIEPQVELPDLGPLPRRFSQAEKDRALAYEMAMEDNELAALAVGREMQLEAALRDKKAAEQERDELKSENSKLHRRNCWLETGIACAKSDRLGMKAKLDAYNSSGCSDADEAFNAGIEAAASGIEDEENTFLNSIVGAIREEIRSMKRPSPATGGTE